MKKILLFTLFIIAFASFKSFAQTTPPTLSLVGSSPSLAKGTINTEVLTAVIQQKQEEIEKRVFRNTIVKEFNKSKYTENLKNFTTYYYLYNLMDAIISGKNKTAITKSITESSMEFAYVLGFALYYSKVTKFKDTVYLKSFISDNLINNYFTITTDLFKNASVNYKEDHKTESYLNLGKGVVNFNILIDLCYDVILNSNIARDKFNFKKDLNDNEFRTWYLSDNAYIKSLSNLDTAINKSKDSAILKLEKNKLEQLKNDINIKLNNFLDLSKFSNSIIEELHHQIDSLKLSDLSVKSHIITLVSNLDNDINKNNFITNLDTVNLDSLNDNQIKEIDSIKANYITYKELHNFYADLKKSNYRDFTLTKSQYDGMKFLLQEFSKLAKNQYENNVVSTVIDFLLENSIVEFAEKDGLTPTTEKYATDSSGKGYLYVDIESLVTAIQKKFMDKPSYGSWKPYITPFFSMGVNTATFLNRNSGLAGEPNSSLTSLNFASEKIGVKWKLWNWKYTRSFDAGQKYRYGFMGLSFKSRAWLRPQPQPLISDLHVIVYGSGLLYNIVDLKSNSSFNNAILGTGLGLTFYNGLSINVGLGCPYTDNKLDFDKNMFFNFGIDIPIIDYIAGLKK